MQTDRDGKLAYAIADLPKVVSLGRSFIYEEIRTGKLRTVKAGRRTLVLADDLKSWLAELSNQRPRRLESGPQS